MCETLFPLQDPQVKCGLRSDLPKKERRHAWLELGPDVRHFGDGSFADAIVHACLQCGADKFGKADWMEDDDTLTVREIRRALRRIKNTDNTGLIPADTLMRMIIANAKEYREKDHDRADQR